MIHTPNPLPPAREVLADKRPEHERVLDRIVDMMLDAAAEPVAVTYRIKTDGAGWRVTGPGLDPRGPMTKFASLIDAQNARDCCERAAGHVQLGTQLRASVALLPTRACATPGCHRAPECGHCHCAHCEHLQSEASAERDGDTRTVGQISHPEHWDGEPE